MNLPAAIVLGLSLVAAHLALFNVEAYAACPKLMDCWDECIEADYNTPQCNEHCVEIQCEPVAAEEPRLTEVEYVACHHVGKEGEFMLTWNGANGEPVWHTEECYATRASAKRAFEWMKEHAGGAVLLEE
jgi:uncharacterized protein YegP (UPF0339 family)